MKNVIISILCLFLVNLNISSPKALELSKSKIIESYGKIPLSFTSNEGQLDSQVKFSTTGSGATMFFTSEGTTFLFSRSKKEYLARKQRYELENIGRYLFKLNPLDIFGKKMPEFGPAYYSLKLRFVNANPKPVVVGEEMLSCNSNYFIGNDPNKWRSDVSNYGKVCLKNLYPGIDLVYYGNQRSVKYDFVVQPGVDPSQIMLAYDFGNNLYERGSISINEKEELIVSMPFGELIERKPYAYQNINGKIIEVGIKYKIINHKSNTFTFYLESYNTHYPLIIDPELTYSSLFGGNGVDYIGSMTTDANSNLHILGCTNSSNFPTTSGAYDASYNGSFDVVVFKLSGADNSLEYSTYFGGSGDDYYMGDICVDNAGNIYISGSTSSSNFPITSGAYDMGYNGNTDGFITKFNSLGNALIYSTYIGGNNYEEVIGMKIDNGGNVYVTGETGSSNFPTTSGAYDLTFNGGTYDIFVSKLNSSGSSLIFSTLIGGSGDDYGTGIVVDANLNVWVSGNVGNGFPTTSGAYDQTFNGGNIDIAILKLDSSGSSLIYSTFIGGSGDDGGSSACPFVVDGNGNIYHGGVTHSSNFPVTSGSYDISHNGIYDCCLFKLNPSGSALEYSTFLGGSGGDQIMDMEIDNNGNTYISGRTNSANFPTTANAYDRTLNGDYDAFLCNLNSTGTTLNYSTFLGGNNEDGTLPMAIDGNSNVYIGGYTQSSDFPTTNGTSYSGTQDAFVAKFSFRDIVPPSKPANLQTTQVGAKVRLSWTKNIESDLWKYVIYRSTSSTVTTSDSLSFVYKNDTTCVDSSVSIGNTYYYKIAAVDSFYNYSELSDSVRIVISVSLALNDIGNKTVQEGQRLEFEVSSSYNGTRTLTYSMTSNLPSGAGASFNSTTKRFLWNPNFHSSGVYTVTFSVTDGIYSDSETITITVQDVDRTAGLARADTARITSGTGGSVKVKGTGTYTEHQVYIPPNALPEDKTVIVKPPTTSDIPSAQLDSVPSAINFEVQGSESGYVFTDSVELTIEYKDFEVKDKKNRMKVHHWDKDNGMWKREMSPQTIDTVNNKITTKVKHFTVFGAIEISSITTTSSASTGWNMVGIPVEPEEVTDPGTYFADDIKPWKVEEANSCIYKYREPTNSWVIPSLIQNGLGYVIYGFESSTLDCPGLQVTGDITHTLTYTNNNGWHLLGNPYAVSIDWDDIGEVSRGAGISNIYYRWTGNQYEFYPGGGLTRNISAWQGFWVRTTINNDTINIRYPGISKKAKSEDFSNNIAWRIQIEAYSGTNQDMHNYIGVSDRASCEYDGYDVYELVPLNNEFISCYFPHADWEENKGNFTQDIRPLTDNEPIVWEFEVATNSNHENVTLTWKIPAYFDPGLQVKLTIPDGKQINMQEDTEYRYSIAPHSLSKEANMPLLPFKDNPTDFTQKLSGSGFTIKKFSITVLKKAIHEESAMIPSVFYLNQNYPNPFNPATTIEYGLPEKTHVSVTIYNILGQEVRNLTNTLKEAGVHKVMWDGKDNRGIDTASGVYLYKISAEKFHQVRKLILLR